MNNCLCFLADLTLAKICKEMCQEKNPCLSTKKIFSAFSHWLRALQIAKREGGIVE